MEMTEGVMRREIGFLCFTIPSFLRGFSNFSFRFVRFFNIDRSMRHPSPRSSLSFMQGIFVSSFEDSKVQTGY